MKSLAVLGLAIFSVFKDGDFLATPRIARGIKERKNVKDFQKGDILTLPCGMSPIKYATKDCEPALKKLRRILKAPN